MKLTPLVYAGIGSRETPEDVLALMRAVGAWLGQRGWTLRSGGAQGADSAFDEGARSVQGAHEIYLPEPGHKLHLRPGTEHDPAYVVPELAYGPLVWAEATRLASQAHPGFVHLSEAAAKLIIRNTFQILGPDLASPASMVVCFGQGSVFDRTTGAVINLKGGTGQAIRLAAEYDIPVYNLALPEHRRTIEHTIGYAPQLHVAPAISRGRARSR